MQNLYEVETSSFLPLPNMPTLRLWNGSPLLMVGLLCGPSQFQNFYSDSFTSFLCEPFVTYNDPEEKAITFTFESSHSRHCRIYWLWGHLWTDQNVTICYQESDIGGELQIRWWHKKESLSKAQINIRRACKYLVGAPCLFLF